MPTYMFITKGESEPERVKDESGFEWSCSKSTRAGDFALVYVGGSGVSYQWRVASDAEASEKWGYTCNVEFVSEFSPPITLQELRTAIPKEEWNPPHQNFRGFRSITIPNAIVRHIKALRPSQPLSLVESEHAFINQIKESLELPAEQRRQRLLSAPRMPSQITVISTVFVRNADVVAEVLLRANGICESCGSPAPFRRASDDSPYLEVHHRVRLSDGGEDTTDNALALCPNCHRQAHYGARIA